MVAFLVLALVCGAVSVDQTAAQNKSGPNFIVFDIIQNSTAQLGESPRWDAEAKVLYYVDITAKQIIRYDPKADEIKRATLSCPAVTPALPVAGNLNQLLVGCGRTLLLVTIDWSGRGAGPLVLDRPLLEVDKEYPDNRFNDGRVGPNGEIFMGVMGLKGKPGSLYRFTKAGGSIRANEKLAVTKLDTGFGNANGMDWSPDFKTFYLVDSTRKTIYVYDYDIKTSSIGKRSVFLDYTERNITGSPDGIMIDQAGIMWIANLGPGELLLVDLKTRKVVDKLLVGAPYPPAMEFGGDDLKTLYVTTSLSLTPKDQINRFPDSGSLFRFRGFKNGQGQKPRKAKLYCPARG